MTPDMKAVLIVVVLFGAAWFVNYLFREWPRAKRTLWGGRDEDWDAHVDDAIRVADSYRLHPAVKEATIRRTGDAVEQALRSPEGQAYAAEVIRDIRRRRGGAA